MNWLSGTSVAFVVSSALILSSLTAADAAPYASISGSVSTAGSASFGGVLQLYRHADDGRDVWYSGHSIEVSPAGGAYEFTYLQPGTYRICFETSDPDFVSECYQDSFPPSPYFGGTDLRLAEGQAVTDVDMELSAAGKIAGTLSRMDGANPTDSRSAVDAQAFMHVQGPATAAYRWERVAAEFAQENGNYTLGSLPSGTFRVCFAINSWFPALSVECFDDQDSITEAADVSVTAPQTTTGIDAELGLSIEITGAVVTADGSPLAASLTLYRLVEGAWREHPSCDFCNTRMLTGNFRIRDLRPGTYRMKASSTGMISEWWNGKPTFDTADDIVLAYGDSLNLNFQLVPSEIAQSAPTATPTPAPAPAPTPTISFDRNAKVRGEVRVRSRIRVVRYRATVTGGTATYTFQWYANGKKIRRATTPSLLLTGATRGKRVTVRVTASAGSTTKSIRVPAGRVEQVTRGA